MNRFSTAVAKRYSSRTNKILASKIADKLRTAKIRNHFRNDEYHKLKFDKYWQYQIVEREAEIYKSWCKILNSTQDKESYGSYIESWTRDVNKRTDPEVQSVPELYGEYFYLQKSVFENGKTYSVFCRTHNKTGVEEEVLDLRKIPQINDPSEAYLDKIKVSDDHTRIAFNADLQNNE